jgi:hypothetical protein
MPKEKTVKEKAAKAEKVVQPKEKTATQKLKEFKEFVNSITDDQLLKSAESLMTDMSQVEVMKEKIEMLESKFCEGDRVAFWFFTVGLDKDSIDIATNTVKGRIEFVKNKEEREKRNKDIDNKKLKEEEEKNNPKPEVASVTAPELSISLV